jgi:hypothetical protein
VKRALLIALLVLVPFGALVALGFSMLKEPPPPPLPDRSLFPNQGTPLKVGSALQAALAPDASAPAPIALLPIPERPLLPLPAPTAPPPEEEPVAPAVPADPVTAGVEPLIQQCFRDVADRVKGPIRVTVAFDPTPGGGYTGVVVKKASWPDPHLTACITDAFEDAKFEPTGFAVRRQTRTFTFGYADAGR